MGEALGQVVSVNVGRARTVEWHGRSVTTAIWKAPVDGPVSVGDEQLAGDEQADLRVHGGVDKAVYAYSVENYGWWAGSMPDTAFGPGLFGENLTTEGVDLEAAVIGERWAVGSAVLEVSEPRFPCSKLGIRMGDAAFVDRFAQAGRPGTYLAIEAEGDLGAGDTVHRLHRPHHGLTIGTVERAYNAQPHLIPRLIEVDDLSESWRDWANRAMARTPRGQARARR